jgi:hypothetical protein
MAARRDAADCRQRPARGCLRRRGLEFTSSTLQRRRCVQPLRACSTRCLSSKHRTQMGAQVPKHSMRQIHNLQEGQVQRLRYWHRHRVAGALSTASCASRTTAGVALLWLAGV